MTTDVLDRLEPLAGQHQTQVGAARHELQTVETLAKNTGGKWRKNNLVPAASLKYVDQVHSTAVTLGKTIDEFNEAWQSCRFTANPGPGRLRVVRSSGHLSAPTSPQVSPEVNKLALLSFQI